MASGPRPSIIVADDDAELCSVIEEMLTDAGFLVFLASGGEELLAIVEQGIRPALVLCDVLMPGLTVDDLVAALRRSERARDVTIALMTGGTCEGLPEADYVLKKPFGLEALIALAQDAVARTASARRASSV
jgi:CheY-like chemotaxis protein